MEDRLAAAWVSYWTARWAGLMAAQWDYWRAANWAVQTAARTAALSVLWKAVRLADDLVEPSDCLRSDDRSVAPTVERTAGRMVVQKDNRRAERWAYYWAVVKDTRWAGRLVLQMADGTAEKTVESSVLLSAVHWAAMTDDYSDSHSAERSGSRKAAEWAASSGCLKAETSV
jgi:hypothetical protein